jgi:hypothetical protein
MSYLPNADEQGFVPDAGPAVADPMASRFFPILSSLVDRLGDRLDHPEIWPLLADAAGNDDVVELRDLIEMLEPGQAAPVSRILNLLGGMLHTLSVNRERGLAFLAAMAAQHAHCPQIAGAIFFLERHGTAKSADLSSRFCDAPFVKFETLMDGTVAPCCSIWTQQRLGQLDGSTADQIWNSAAAQEMRASILDGSYRHCHKQRCTFINEDALPLRDEVTDPAMRAVIDNGTTHMEQGPRWLFLAHDVTCNLACPSCRDGVQAADEAQELRFDKIEQQVFRPMLEGTGEDGAKKVMISLSGQGDPWSSPHYRSILRYMADHELDVDLELHTNALLMGEGRWAQYAGLDRYRAMVNVSIDACSPWVYERVRRPGKWDKLYTNLEFIAAKRARGEFREFHLNATVQLDNFHEMPALMRLAQGLGADSMRLYMIQNTGGHLAPYFTRCNIGDPAHPLHPAFLETLRDPILADPIAHLYDVTHWRDRALEAELPSDSLGADFSREDLAGALRAAGANAIRRAALCVAGRIKFADDASLLQIEAQALYELGFAEQARYRLNESVALGGEAIALG